MNEINRRFLHYETRAKFEEDLDKIPYDAIVFIDEGRTIYTHGEEYCGVDLSGYLKTQEAEQEYAKKDQIPDIPTNVSAFTNDAGYLTQHQDLSNYALKADIPEGADLSQYLKTTDAEREYAKKTDIPELLDLSDYYTKGETDNKFAKTTDIPDLSDYLKKDDGIIGVDTEARALAQEAKDAANAAQETATSKQDKLSAGDGIIISNGIVKLRKTFIGEDSIEALIVSVEDAFKELLRIIDLRYVRRDEVYKDEPEWGEDGDDMVAIKIGSAYYFYNKKILYAMNVPDEDNGTITIPEDGSDVDGQTLVLRA